MVFRLKELKEKRITSFGIGEKMFKLEEHHLEEAKKIALKHRTRKRCDRCYDRGWIGVNEQNLLITCSHCVDLEAVMKEWKEYVSGHADLKEHFAELFEEKQIGEGTEPEIPVVHEHKKSHPQPLKKTFVPGQKRTGLKKV